MSVAIILSLLLSVRLHVLILWLWESSHVLQRKKSPTFSPPSHPGLDASIYSLLHTPRHVFIITFATRITSVHIFSNSFLHVIWQQKKKHSLFGHWTNITYGCQTIYIFKLINPRPAVNQPKLGGGVIMELIRRGWGRTNRWNTSALIWMAGKLR